MGEEVFIILLDGAWIYKKVSMGLQMGPKTLSHKPPRICNWASNTLMGVPNTWYTHDSSRSTIQFWLEVQNQIAKDNQLWSNYSSDPTHDSCLLRDSQDMIRSLASLWRRSAYEPPWPHLWQLGTSHGLKPSTPSLHNWAFVKKFDVVEIGEVIDVGEVFDVGEVVVHDHDMSSRFHSWAPSKAFVFEQIACPT